ncbi:MAG: PD-(D/E)XK nuclease family protein [Stenotrophobium sp.]
MTAAAPPRLLSLPPHADALAWAASTLVRQHHSALPDLSPLTLIVPAAAQIPRLRKLLLEHAGGALLGPAITTLGGFSRDRATLAPLAALDCKLLLAQALQRHPDLFSGQDRWALADALFSLFEELSAATPELADDVDRFLARVERGYGSARLAQISREARATHLLWQAYLHDTGQRSPAVGHLQALATALDTLAPTEQVYLIGHDHFSGAETRILKNALARQSLTLWLQGPGSGRGRQTFTALLHNLTPADIAVVDGSEHEPDPRAQILDCAFADDGLDLRQRAASIGNAVTGLTLAVAGSPEHEARMVDLAVRRALLAGQRDIAVVTQDRRLARRLRALLERAGIPLQDDGGWALSTSAAAASLGHWLDCCEQDFPFRALLDLLKSNFFDGITGTEIDELEIQIYKHGIQGGLERAQALENAPGSLLGSLRRAAKFLPAIHAPEQPGQIWASRLIQSLQTLPLWAQWQTDAAGMVLTTTLLDLEVALARQSMRLRWSEFRNLLERTLEQATFIPQTADSPVRLLTLDQAQGLRCERLILAGAGAAQFPGRPSAEPVFNHGVRAELGLSYWRERLDLQLGRFRALLHAAPEILFTYAPENEGEPAQPCPWLELLQTLGIVQPDDELAQLATSPQVEIAQAQNTLPEIPGQPCPQLSDALLPKRLSAGRHQSLIDCPYQFYASSALRLQALREPDEPVDRREFGNRVHLIMQAFETQQDKLPSPFAKPVTAENRAEAERKFDELARAVFADDLRNRALARVWLTEFLDFIPDIASWLAARSATWPRVQPELSLQRALTPELLLHGIADRVESRADGACCIVDFKSGQAPKASDVVSGEAVQATHYALLVEHCVQVEYFVIHRDRKKPVTVEGGELQDARDGVRTRLLEIFSPRDDGIAMPANGNEKVCQYCDYAGLCRHGAWHE